MDDIAQRAHAGPIGPTNPRILEDAVDAVVDLLDPDVEPRSMIDAINLITALDQAIQFVVARPEFLSLNGAELQAIQDEVLNRIHWRA